MYFEEHQKQDIIAKTVGVSQSYISQVIQKDTRYTNEKEIRHNESMKKKAEYNKEYSKTYIRKKKKNLIEEYYALLELLKEIASFYQQNLKCQTLHLLNGIDQYINMIKILAI